MSKPALLAVCGVPEGMKARRLIRRNVTFASRFSKASSAPRAAKSLHAMTMKNYFTSVTLTTHTNAHAVRGRPSLKDVEISQTATVIIAWSPYWNLSR